MELDQVKRIAADVMKVGVGRVKIVSAEEVLQAMTKDDVRALIRKGFIQKRKNKGIRRVRAKKNARQKKQRRRKARGKRKGAIGSRVKSKKVWMKGIRALRTELIKMKPKLKSGAYRKLYNMSKGGYFRSKSHLRMYVKERKLMKPKKVEKKETKK